MHKAIALVQSPKIVSANWLEKLTGKMHILKSTLSTGSNAHCTIRILGVVHGALTTNSPKYTDRLIKTINQFIRKPGQTVVENGIHFTSTDVKLNPLVLIWPQYERYLFKSASSPPCQDTRLKPFFAFTKPSDVTKNIRRNTIPILRSVRALKLLFLGPQNQYPTLETDPSFLFALSSTSFAIQIAHWMGSQPILPPRLNIVVGAFHGEAIRILLNHVEVLYTVASAFLTQQGIPFIPPSNPVKTIQDIANWSIYNNTNPTFTQFFGNTLPTDPLLS